jgi:hypothetical protein
MNWKDFFSGIAVAAISGAAATSAQAVADPASGTKALGTAAAAGAIIGVAGWLKQSPVRSRRKKVKEQSEEQK